MTRFDERIVRRETHSPRTAAAVVVALLLTLATAYLAAESLLQLMGLRPLLAAPRQLAGAVPVAPSTGTPVLIAVALASGLAGLWLTALAVLPGRRPRRRLRANAVTIVADDDMLASGLARSAARAAGVSPDAVSVALGRRTAVVRIVPVSGLRVDRDDVRRAVADEFAATGAGHPVRISVVIASTGRVGS